VIPGRLRRLHFVGLGGAGMGALAELLLDEGFAVGGCDLAPSGRLRSLARRGAAVAVGHDPAHLEGVDAVVVTAAVAPDNPELQAARERGIPVVKRATLLGEVMRGRIGVAVAGTHGKTTTSALTGYALHRAGLDPTVIVGGEMRAFGAAAHRGCGRLLVCEADEYDRSFLELRPAWLVVTNVEPEHLDTYGSVEELEAAFVELAERVPFYGAVIGCADDDGARRVSAATRRRVVTYGLGEGAWLRAVDLRPGPDGTRFVVTAGGEVLGEAAVAQPGAHNVRNALAALAVGLELGASFAELAAACAAFPGVARRFELLGERGGVTVVDDYAHHPTEIAALLQAARQRFGDRRLVVVFQPHLYSRTRRFAAAFGEALAAADTVVLLPIFPAREEPVPGVSSALIAAAVRERGRVRTELAPSFADALRLLDGMLAPGDVLLTVGAGDVDRVATGWLGGEG